MLSEKDELEARLLKQAETTIRPMLEQKGERRDLSISEMEDLVGEFEIDVRQTMMQELVEETHRPEGACVKPVVASYAPKARSPDGS